MPINAVHPDWKPILRPETQKPYFQELVRHLQAEEREHTVYPPLADRFNALSLAPGDVRVVILGQDPYHGPGQAHGLAFSVREGVSCPPSLRNIFAELENEGYGSAQNRSGCLEAWHKQGVLLLNAALTVTRGEPGSHQQWGWAPFTDRIIRYLAEEGRAKAFLLWGNFAKKKAGTIDVERHLLLTSPHPSPFSAHSGFFGNGHFRAVNEWLKSRNEKVIDW